MSTKRKKGAAPRLAADMAGQAGRAADLLKAMAHPQRLRVLCLLVDGERSVGAINEEVDLSQSALSQHLAKLRDEGLVATRRDAQVVYYRLADGPAIDVIRTLHAAYCGGSSR